MSNLNDLLKTMLWFNNKSNDPIQLINGRKISYSEGQTKRCLEMKGATFAYQENQFETLNEPFEKVLMESQLTKTRIRWILLLYDGN